jgi:hypothetical protein
LKRDLSSNLGMLPSLIWNSPMGHHCLNPRIQSLSSCLGLSQLQSLLINNPLQPNQHHQPQTSLLTQSLIEGSQPQFML